MSSFQEVPSKVSFVNEEEKVLQYWKDINAFHESLKQSEGKPDFSFYDGPPFATGLPHYGHILTGTMKDIITRFAHQTGHHVERRFGWDCHGLPIEFEIDKAFNLKSRQDVLAMGIDNYNEECRKIVMKFSSEWRSTVERMGRWIDFDNDYKTLDRSYMESVWWVFGELFKKGLVYRAFKVMPYSTACNTPLSNFELQLNYKEDVQDPSLIVSFPVVASNPTAAALNLTEKASFIAWTTTPWTLPSNLALCVHPELKYLHVRVTKANSFQDAQWILAESRLPWVCAQLKMDPAKDIQVLSVFEGKQLVGITYTPLFEYFYETMRESAFRIVCDNYVTDSSGTGVVHQAPAFGEDDYRVCVENKVVVLDANGRGLPCPLDLNGCFTEEVPDFQGLPVKEADKDIKAYINQKLNRLVLNSTFTHNYPYCWRSDTPLIYRAIPSWFVNVEKIKEKLLLNNKKTHWVPETIRDGRFHNWLENAQDWCVSRNRYWGCPLPLWCSEDFDEILCISSIGELEEYAGRPLSDIHRHFIDDIVIHSKKTGKPLRRIDEVFDCWFESGSMPYGQLHYPFENKEKFHKTFPADFIGEGLDQTRGWFYTLMVLSTALFDDLPPFKNLIVNGLVLASDGKKMSKRLKNYPDPNEIINLYGADALRLYLINSPVVHAETLKFKQEGVRDIVRDCFLPLYNAYRFCIQEIQRYEKVHNIQWSERITQKETTLSDLNALDQWILSSVNSLIRFFHAEMNGYRLYNVVPKLLEFLDSLTNWYVRFNRDRMRGVDGDNEAFHSLNVLFQVIHKLVLLMSPFTPFLSEFFYKNLKFGLKKEEQQDSIHYTMLPQFDEKYLNEKIEEQIRDMRRVIEAGRTLREQLKINLKTPLSKLYIVHQEEKVLENCKELETYITQQLNVLSVEFCHGQREEFREILSYSALPNNVKLGKSLGKKFAVIGKQVRALDSVVLQAFVTGKERKGDEGKESVERDEKGIYIQMIDGETKLYEDDVLIQVTANPKHPVFMESEGAVKFYSDNSIVVMYDTTSDDNIVSMAMTREVVNNIQKVRKESTLVPEDDIKIVLTFHKGEGDVEREGEVEGETEESLLPLPAALDMQKVYLNSLVRKDIVLCQDVEAMKNAVAQFASSYVLNIHKAFTLHNQTVQCHIYRNQ